MNDDLVRIFAQPHATFRPPAIGPHATAPRQAGPRGDGGPHIELREQPVSEQSLSRHEPDRQDRDFPPYDRLGELQLEAIGLKKSYRKASVEIPVLKGVDLGVRRSEFLAIVGQSGSGKSTLLHLLGTLDSPDDGQIAFDGRRIDNLPGRERDRLRNRRFGMIFQFYHLLPELTTLENVLAPLMIGSGVFGFLRSRRKYRGAATRLLELVGLGHRLKHRPRELSGGEMQRAAIARALIAGPDLLLADEPTGNLDQATGREILELLTALNRQQKLTIVMVTHDPAIAQRADRVVRLLDGRIE